MIIRIEFQRKMFTALAMGGSNFVKFYFIKKQIKLSQPLLLLELFL